MIASKWHTIVIRTKIASMLNFFKKDPQPATTNEPAPPSWAERLKQGLARTRDNFGSSLGSLFGGGKIDEAVYEELETILLTADVGVGATQTLLEEVRKEVKRQALSDTSQLRSALQEALIRLLEPLAQPLDTGSTKPYVIMLAGVNGAGKTTTIGKLAWLLQSQGKSVLIAAGDTFRAAAREQLEAWGERNDVHVVAQSGGDPAAVIFDAVNAAKARGIDVVLADTAGRLPTQLNLMEEIRKVKRVIDKALPGAPHEVLLVLDANTGQNAVTQVRAFDDALQVTGLALTKLDGTAKGGVIAAIAQARPIPIRFIGVGEQIEDLQPFHAREFVEALFA
jgi:fused signal recognition particle receptor